MNDIKDLLAEVLHDPAPPMASSAEVLTLARRAERRRRGWWAAGGAALTVAAMTVAIGYGAPGSRPDPPPPIGPGAPASDPPPAPVAAALRYRPTWLPPGFGERMRIASLSTAIGGDVDHHVDRYWTKADNVRIDLSLRRAQGPDDPQANGGAPVDINGSAGVYHGGEKSHVSWRIGDTVLSVKEVNLGLSQVDLLRVARSVQPDPATMTAPFRLGHVPTGVIMHSLEFSGASPTDWSAEVGGVPPGPSSSPPPSPEKGKGRGQPSTSLYVALGTRTIAPDGGEPLTIGGRPARYVTSPMGFSFVVVDRGQGVLLTVTGSRLSRADLVATAEGVQVDGPPDVSWIGAA